MSQMQTALNGHYNRHQYDRMGLTMFFALALHAIIILGISFDIIDIIPEDTMPTMEITLVHSHSKDAPEDADYLAQANQKGGGNLEERVRPSSPLSNPYPTPEDGLAPNSELAMTPPPLKKSEQQTEIMTAEQSPFTTDSREFKRDIPTETNSVTAAQLYERSRQIARLRAEIQQLKQATSRTPHHTYATGTNAKEYRFASYIEAWRDKVEKIGTLNYPEQAIRNNVNGELLLDVAINPDGTIQSMRILRSSGKAIIDDAAKRIVSMAAPYPPLTKEILKDTDVLHISLVWHFRVKNGLTTSFN
jgi:periplasmic protein TonB